MFLEQDVSSRVYSWKYLSNRLATCRHRGMSSHDWFRDAYVFKELSLAFQVEMRNSAPTDTTSTNIFLNEREPQILWNITKNVQDMTADFHVYKVLWTPNKLVWYIDGKEIRQITNPKQIASKKLKLVINLALLAEVEIGEGEYLPAYFVIDYVLVRQTSEQAAEALREENASSSSGGVPKFVGPLVGTILGLLLVSITVFYTYSKRRRYQRMLGHMMRKSGSWRNSDFPLNCFTGHTRDDQLLETYCKILQISPYKLQISKFEDLMLPQYLTSPSPACCLV